MTNTMAADRDLFGYSPSIAPEAESRYPQSPGFKGAINGPSHKAAQTVAPIVTGLRLAVLDYLRTTAAEPMTADQIAVAIGRSPFSIRPRVAELHALGLIEPAAERGVNESGMTANRWKAVRS